MAARLTRPLLGVIFSNTKTRIRPFSAVLNSQCPRNDIHHQATPTVLGGASLHSLPGHRVLEQLPGWLQCRAASTHLVDTKTSLYLGVAGIEELEDYTPLSNEELQKDVTRNINTNLVSGEAGRLFAVVQVRGKQFKVTPNDIIVVKYDFPPNVGDKIRLEKVLVAGGKDFTLFGKPLLSRETVNVEATVVEKTLTHNRVWFVYARKRAGFKKFHLYREALTVLAINSVQVAPISQEEDTTQMDSQEE